MIDVGHQISAVRRHVGARVLEAGEARIDRRSDLRRHGRRGLGRVHRRRAHPALVPAHLGDLRLHGRYQLEGNADGTIERCDPPKGFAATWEYGGDISWIEVRIAADPAGGTRFELERTAHVDDERWAEFGPGAVGVGWDMMLMGLAAHLSSGQPVGPGTARRGWCPTRAGGSWRSAATAGATRASRPARRPGRRASRRGADHRRLHRRLTPPPLAAHTQGGASSGISVWTSNSTAESTPRNAPLPAAIQVRNGPGSKTPLPSPAM